MKRPVTLIRRLSGNKAAYNSRFVLTRRSRHNSAFQIARSVRAKLLLNHYTVAVLRTSSPPSSHVPYTNRPLGHRRRCRKRRRMRRTGRCLNYVRAAAAGRRRPVCVVSHLGAYFRPIARRTPRRVRTAVTSGAVFHQRAAAPSPRLGGGADRSLPAPAEGLFTARELNSTPVRELHSRVNNGSQAVTHDPHKN